MNVTQPQEVPRARRPVARPPQRWVGIALAALGILFVSALTLTPQPDGATATGWCLVCGDVGAADFLLNVVLFVPFGLGLRLAGVPTGRALGLVVAATIAVELPQLRLVTGRDASVGDIAASASSWSSVRSLASVFERMTSFQTLGSPSRPA